MAKRRLIEVDEETYQAFHEDKPTGKSWKLYMREKAVKLKILKVK